MIDGTHSPQMAPELERLLAAQRAAAPVIDRYGLPFAQSRQVLLEERQRTRGTPLAMHAVRDELLSVDDRSVPLRWFFASQSSAARMPIVYLHGGGWCVGSNETHDTVLRHLAHASDMPVCAVDYSLAPEHPFPAALDDVHAAIQHVLSTHCEGLKLPRQLVLAGDSAGANLALAEAMTRRDAGHIDDIAALVLYYGVYGLPRNTGSFAAYGDGRFGLSLKALERYQAAYLPHSARAEDPRVFPLLGQLGNLPASWLLASELDPLLDDSIDLQRALQDAGTPNELRVAKGMPHGFLNQANQLAYAAELVRESADFIRRQTSVPSSSLR